MWRSGDKTEGPSKMVPGPKMMLLKMKRKRDSRGRGEEWFEELHMKELWIMRFGWNTLTCAGLWIVFAAQSILIFRRLVHLCVTHYKTSYDALCLCTDPRICRSSLFLISASTFEKTLSKNILPWIGVGMHIGMCLKPRLPRKVHLACHALEKKR